MADIGTVEITLKDLEDVRQTLAACLTFMVARDLMESQAQMNNLRQSPLTNEVERMSTRFDGYMADHLLQLHEASLQDDEPDNGDSVMGGPEPGFEPLSDAPLGAKAFPRQEGRRMTAEELAPAATDGDA